MTAIATNAATVRAVVAQLAAWGWPSELWPGWETRRNRQTPLVWESVTVHHTGAGPVSTSYMANPADRAALVVLCNAHITKDRIRFLAAGGASHAGMSDRATYARMRAGQAPLTGDMKPGADSPTFSANRLSFGIEVDNAKTTPEWDEWMQGAVVALCAALHKVCGWSVDPSPRVITHKELTRRKPGDPIMDAGRLRSLVREFLAAP
ncbi:MAG TPA: N-acetylmuramoyl-L-alanine amidase, partial [Piscinibacter sp.]|nr:N-acetylmuramoyl-L-alanine amidase [Piscinibacter sp.]